MNDAETFALAFGLVWLALGGYLLYLHRLAERLARHLADAERSSTQDPNRPKG